jgi:DNA-binding CsgD family transcriptional regulator
MTVSVSNTKSLLTAKQREVFELLALGHCPDEVAAALGCKRSTVDNHAANIRKKLGLPANDPVAVYCTARKMKVLATDSFSDISFKKPLTGEEVKLLRAFAAYPHYQALAKVTGIKKTRLYEKMGEILAKLGCTKRHNTVLLYRAALCLGLW